MPDLCAHSLEVMLPVPSDYWGSANISNTPKLCKHDVMVALIFFFMLKLVLSHNWEVLSNAIL